MTVPLQDERRDRRSGRAGGTGTLRRIAAAAVAFVTAASGATMLAPAAAAAAPAPQVQAAGSAPQAAAALAAADEPYKVLVFHKTAGFRHTAGINAGIAAIQALGTTNNFTVDATQDAAVFTAANLAQYKTVVFMSTTGDVLDNTQQAAFEAYIKGGGGYFGIHSATDTEASWPWYVDLAGATFTTHPAGTPQGKVFVEDRVHPMTAAIGDEVTINEEWYNFNRNPRANVHVLLSADVTSYSGSTMGRDHPLAWCQDSNTVTGAGRAAYTALGHDATNWPKPWFNTMILNGIKTTAGVLPSDCGASLAKNYDVVSLDDNTSDPMMLDVAADGSVFYIQQNGALRYIDPATEAVAAVATLPVTTSNESGLLGMALDPNFVTNKHIFVFHSPNGANVDRLSRFTFDPTTKTLVAGSEKVVLDVPVQRAECCHHGGSMVFDGQGNLYLATGDNTNPFASNNYSPIDWRSGRSSWDAARTSGNTNSLSGKVLKITPQPDGTYTVPAGNLFAPGTDKTKPEIFAMGLRNPFRIDIDKATGHVLVADYGPDANSAQAGRGPANTVEWNIVDTPGFYGWPFCTGPNNAYNRWDFATNVSGTVFECATGVVNDSPNNTGLTQLPAAIPADIYYSYGATTGNFPEVGGGGAPMAGPVYNFDPAVTGNGTWPAYWNGKALWSEWNRNTSYANLLTDNGTRVQKVNQISSIFTLPAGAKRSGTMKVMDSKFGPDGSLYVIDWGSGWSANTNSGIYRIDYLLGNRSPIARASADKLDGNAPLAIQFSSQGSSDPEETPLTYSWNFGDGQTSTQANPSHSFAAGTYRVQLTVTDGGGKSASSSLEVVSGNNRPVVEIATPLDGQFFEFGDQIKFDLKVTDAEDGSTTAGTIPCNLVLVQNQLGHYSVGDAHAHPMGETSGCTGTVQTLEDGHGADVWLYWVIEASYTDNSAGTLGTAGKLTGTDSVVLQTKRRQAEHYNGTGRLAGSTSTGDAGVVVEAAADPQGGTQQIGYVEPGDWVSYDRVNFSGIDSVSARVAGSTGADLELRWNAADGPLIATIPAKPTAGWTTYDTSTVALTNAPTGVGTVYVVAKNAAATGSVVNINWFDFNGKGATDNQRPTITSASVTPVSGSAPLRVNLAAAATDAEGDAITYKWEMGTTTNDVVNGATGSFIYTTPGTYQVKLTVTDAKGAYGHREFEVKVNAPQTACQGKFSDTFDGPTLNTTRWSVVRPNGNLSIVDGQLRIPTAAADIYQTTNTAPNIVLQPMPAGAWEISTKVTGNLARAYQQGGLIVYGDDNNYAKLVFSGRSTSGDAAARVIQYAHESNASAQEANSANLGTSFPNSVWLKFTYDGTNLLGSYSVDGTTWVLTSTFSNWGSTRKTLAGFGNNIRVGLLSLANTNNVTNADFDFFKITPDEPIPVGPDDTFDGPALDLCRWTVLRPNPASVSFAGGWLQLASNAGEPNAAENVLLQPQPAGSSPNHWVVETKVDASAFTGGYSQAGLIAYATEGSFVKLDYVRDSATNGRVELRSTVDGTFVQPQPQFTSASAVWYLRLARTGNDFTGSYSADGVTWTTFAQTVANVPVASTGKVGVFVAGVQDTTSRIGKIDYFKVVDDTPVADTVAPVTTATVSNADPAIVTLTATDNAGGSGVAVTQYRIGTQTWSTYTAPVSVPKTGSVQTIEFRSIDVAGNEEASKFAEIPAAVPTAPQAEISAAAACISNKAVLTVRYKNTAAEAVNVTVTTPLGTKTFTNVGPNKLVANNFAAAGKTYPAGDVTITVTATDDGASMGSSTTPFAAKTCA